jgi:hypothetical protein
MAPWVLGFLIRSVTCRDRYRVCFIGVQRLYIVCGDSKEEVRFVVMLRSLSRANQ